MQQYVSSETCELQSFRGVRPLAPHLDPASGPQSPCLWEFHFLQKEPPHFQTSLRACIGSRAVLYFCDPSQRLVILYLLLICDLYQGFAILYLLVYTVFVCLYMVADMMEVM